MIKNISSEGKNSSREALYILQEELVLMAHTYNPSIWEVRQEDPPSQQWPRIQRQVEVLGGGLVTLSKQCYSFTDMLTDVQIN